MTNKPKMNDKQKKFVDRFNQICEWHYKETKEKVSEHLGDCKLTKKEITECLHFVNYAQTDKYVYDEYNDFLYDNETSEFLINDLKDDDLIDKNRV